jgi:hypothetical protein
VLPGRPLGQLALHVVRRNTLRRWRWARFSRGCAEQGYAIPSSAPSRLCLIPA